MTRYSYSCGCETRPLSDVPPGVVMSLRDPEAVKRAGWYEATNTRDGEHWHKPCRKHLPRRMAKWMIKHLGLDYKL